MTKNLDYFDTANQIKLIEEGFKPHNFSKYMCEAIENQKDVHKAIIGVVNEALEDSVETRSHIEEIANVKEIAKEAVKGIFWRIVIAAFGSGGIITTIATYLFNKFF